MSIISYRHSDESLNFNLQLIIVIFKTHQAANYLKCLSLNFHLWFSSILLNFCIVTDCITFKFPLLSKWQANNSLCKNITRHIGITNSFTFIIIQILSAIELTLIHGTIFPTSKFIPFELHQIFAFAFQDVCHFYCVSFVKFFKTFANYWRS